MAWNWCVNLAKYCELYIITEGEFQDKIETALASLPQGGDMHFYYNPVSDRVRKMCWNQGDWRFYKYYREWQLKTADIAREICRREQIDILHQLNMIGFREPGYLWKVSQETGIPFVWGPIGGLKQFPINYADTGGLKMRLFLALKNRINIWQLKNSSRVDKAFRQASLLISSIPDSYRAIKKYKHLESVVIPETGTNIPYFNGQCHFDSEIFTILWVGKFDFRKRLDLAIKIMKHVEGVYASVVLKVLGTGSERQIEEVKKLASVLGVKNVEWKGNLPHDDVQREMRHAHLFLFTSVSEDTSSVVLEAVSNNLPVICFDTCGMSAVIDEKVGIKIPLTTPQQSVKDFADKITYLYEHRDVLKQMSENCAERAEELSWDNKARQVVELYEKAVRKRV